MADDPVSSGRTYREVRQALADLGLARDQEVRDAGIRLVRLGMIYPLEPGIVRAAARGVTEILVVEEKRPFVERFVREYLYDLAERPRVTGKRDERDAAADPGRRRADRRPAAPAAGPAAGTAAGHAADRYGRSILTAASAPS